MTSLSWRQRLAYMIIGMLIVSVAVGVAEEFTGGHNTMGEGGKLNATSGPLVTLGQTYELRGGQPGHPAGTSMNISTEANSTAINFTSKTFSKWQPAVTIEHVNLSRSDGNWTVVSNLNTTNHNVSIDAVANASGGDDRTNTSVGGPIDRYEHTEVIPNDSERDLRYSSSTGNDGVIIIGNLTANHQYGLVNNDTDNGIDVAQAGPAGFATYTEVTKPGGTLTDVRVESLSTLEVRNESNESELLDGVTVSVKFFGEDQTTFKETSTSSGEIDMDGLPVDEKFIVMVEEDNDFTTRAIIIDDLAQQQHIFLLNKSRPQNETEFEIEDPTGTYADSDTELLVQRALNTSKYTTSNADFEWVTITGDKIGSDRQLTVDLEHEKRYRLKIRNTEGDVRLLGEHVPRDDETIILRPKPLTINISEAAVAENFVWNASYVNSSGTSEIQFEFADPEENTTNLEINISEQGNPSNHFTNQTVTGPIGSTKLTQTLSASEATKTWVVEFTADREGSQIHGKAIVGRNVREQVPGLSDDWQEMLAVLAVILTGASFGAINREAGGVTVGLVGGGFWFAGWLPSAAGAAIVVALFIAVLWKIGSPSLG